MMRIHDSVVPNQERTRKKERDINYTKLRLVPLKRNVSFPF